MTYNPGQFNHIVPYIKGIPEWVIIAGTADADEGQCAVKQWPSIGTNVIGIEPMLENILWQEQNGFPGRKLYTAALGAGLGTGKLYLSDRVDEMPRNSSMECSRGGGTKLVTMITLDWLLKIHGPFNNLLLWMDIEGYEDEALKGGISLFESGCVNWVCVEEVTRRIEGVKFVRDFLKSYNLFPVYSFNIAEYPYPNELDGHRDTLFVRKDE